MTRASKVLAPRFVLISQNRHHLQLLLESLRDLGFQEVAYDKILVDGYIDESLVNLVWSFQMFQFNKLRPYFKPNAIRINHLWMNKRICRKDQIYRTFRSGLDRYGSHVFDFMKEHYYFDELSSQDKEYVFQNKNQGLEEDPDFNSRWLVKGINHGGISLIRGDDWKNHLHSEMFITKYIEPLLIDGYKWDFGLYVLVLSIDPLVVVVHRNGLVRMCNEQYPLNLDSETPKSRYVIKEYSPPWEKISLRDIYGPVLPDKDNQHVFHSHAVCLFIEQNTPWKCSEWWNELKSAAIKMLLVTLPELRRSPEARDVSKVSFELLRMDFNVDYEGKPWLVEINMSPNLMPKVFRTGTDHAMKKSVIFNALQMLSLGGARDRPNPFFKTTIKQHCQHPQVDFEMLRDTRGIICMLQALVGNKNVQSQCGFCFEWEITQSIGEFIFSYSKRGDFELAYPPLREYIREELTAPETAQHKVLWDVVRDLHKRGENNLYSRTDQALAVICNRSDKDLDNILDESLKTNGDNVECITSGHCLSHQICVAGHCMNDDE